MSKKEAVKAAQILGRLGGKARAKVLTSAQIAEFGSKGGHTRAKNLTAEQRSAIARKASLAAVKARMQRKKEKGKA